MRYLLAIILFLSCLACEGGIPLSGIEGPLVPTASQIPAELHLPQGRLSSQVSGPNTPINEENIKAVAEELFGMLFTNMLGPKALRLDTVARTSGDSCVRYAYEGAVFFGNFTSETIEETHFNFKGDYTVELNDWKNFDGEQYQYFGGGLAYDMTYQMNMRATDAFGGTSKVSGNVDLAGKYRGSISFRYCDLQWNAWRRIFSGTIEVISDDMEGRYYLEKYCDWDSCSWDAEKIE